LEGTFLLVFSAAAKWADHPWNLSLKPGCGTPLKATGKSARRQTANGR
jgi:hypothetical protein